ncbi:MAG: N-acetylmuramoyl-L-alanine amidase [Bacteroidetes bacterium]|nr:N-acetylmuramoyl-L-alanine amidase [Bacteroidota bacterium]
MDHSTHPTQRNTLSLSLIKVRLILLLLGCLLVVPVPARAESTPAVERVSFAARADGNGVVMRIHMNEPVAAFSMPTYREDGAIEVVVFRSHLTQTRTLDPPVGPIRSYRVDQLGNDVVIRLEPGMGPVTASAYRDRTSHDILVGLTGSPPAIPVVATSGSPAPSDMTLSDRLGQAGNASLPRPTADADARRWTLDTIVIDAGHGGKDTGALAADGTREKDVVLAVARKVGQYLEENLDVNVVYTREDDRFITLQGRGHLANQAGGKLFVSIHANSAPDRRAHGTETFFLGLHKTNSEYRVMERENEVVRLEGDASAYEEYDAMTSVMQTLTQSAYMRQSQSLAESIESEFEDRAGRSSRGVKQAGFYVLYGASMPSVLVELGFLSNPSEAAFMRSEDGQAYLASAIFRAIRTYKSEYDQGLHLRASDR